MTKSQKLIGSSVFSLLLLAVAMFSMCSVRMQRLNTDGDIDDLALFDEENGNDEEYQDDLLSRLEVLDDEPGTSGEDTSMENADTDDFFAQMEQETLAESPPALEPKDKNESEGFLTEKLLDDLKSEVDDLQRIYLAKEQTADSLRDRVRNVELPNTASASQASAFIPAEPASTFDRSFSPSPAASSAFDSEVGMLYQDALDDYNGRKFNRAIDKFRDILIRGDAGDLADNCQYWIGESFYALGKYLQAVIEFEKVNVFPGENKITDAQLMVGLSFMKMGDNQQAASELSALTIFYRNATAASKAWRYLDKLERV